jgi:predicted RNase H-like HicB family nuclease/predicted RNA binding protein YcfA (HicA-like mRNA interferase family)
LVKVRDLLRLVEADVHVRRTGSHRHYKHASKPNVVTGHLGDDVPAGTLKSILKSRCAGDEAMNRRYTVIFEPAESNWAAYVPDLPGCITTGKTLEETERNVREAIQGHLRTLREFGDPVPAPVSVARAIEVSTAA